MPVPNKRLELAGDDAVETVYFRPIACGAALPMAGQLRDMTSQIEGGGGLRSFIIYHRPSKACVRGM